MAYHYILPTIENYNPEPVKTKIKAILEKKYAEWLFTESSDTQTTVYHNTNPDAGMASDVVLVTLSKSNPLDLRVKYNEAVLVTKSRDITTTNCGAEDPFKTTGCGEIYVSTPDPEMDEFKYLDSAFRKLIKEM